MLDRMDEGSARWGSGTTGQLWACRLSHLAGLLIVLSLLLAIGWAPGRSSMPSG